MNMYFQTELPTYFSQLKKQRWLNFNSLQPHILMLTTSKSHQQLSCKKSVFCPNNFLMDLISWQLFYITVLWWVILSRIPYTRNVQIFWENVKSKWKIHTNFVVFLENLNLKNQVWLRIISSRPCIGKDLRVFHVHLLFYAIHIRSDKVDDTTEFFSKGRWLQL